MLVPTPPQLPDPTQTFPCHVHTGHDRRKDPPLQHPQGCPDTLLLSSTFQQESKCLLSKAISQEKLKMPNRAKTISNPKSTPGFPSPTEPCPQGQEDLPLADKAIQYHQVVVELWPLGLSPCLHPATQHSQPICALLGWTESDVQRDKSVMMQGACRQGAQPA